MIQPERIIINGILQGYTVYSATPITLLTYDTMYYYNKALYRGHCSVGVAHETVECVAFEEIQEADNFISSNNLTKYDGLNKEWHEQTEKRIILTLEDNAKLLKDVPELAVYIKMNNINSYIDNFIYIYVNYLIPEHEQLIINYNGTIQDNIIAD